VTAPKNWKRLITWTFARGVVVSFHKNQGLLLAGAVAFYTLMSIIPLFGLLLVALSHIVDQKKLLEIVAANLSMVVPGGAQSIMDEIKSFVRHREAASGVGLIGLLFFSTQAFSVLERAMAVIFRQRRERVGRHFLTSLLIPYLYLGALGVGLLIITALTTLIRAARQFNLHIMEWTLSIGSGAEVALWLVRMGSEVLLLSSLYIVLPGGRVRLKHAFLGGIVASVLWEGTRRLLVWYYENLSLVGVVYGSLATTIVALLTMDAAAVIILFSAQVIAEYERP